MSEKVDKEAAAKESPTKATTAPPLSDDDDDDEEDVNIEQELANLQKQKKKEDNSAEVA